MHFSSNTLHISYATGGFFRVSVREAGLNAMPASTSGMPAAAQHLHRRRCPAGRQRRGGPVWSLKIIDQNKFATPYQFHTLRPRASMTCRGSGEQDQLDQAGGLLTRPAISTTHRSYYRRANGHYFAVQASAAGAGSATVACTPLQTDIASAKWTPALFALTGAVPQRRTSMSV